MSRSNLEILCSPMILSFGVNTFVRIDIIKKVILLFIIVIVTVCPYWSFQADCQVINKFALLMWAFR